MTLLNELQSERQDEQRAARAAYAVILRRASNPAPGDVEELKTILDTLGIDESQLTNDINAVNRHAALTHQRLSNDERDQIAQQGQEELAAVQEAQRTFLAAMVTKLRLLELPQAWDALNRLLISVERGTPTENAHLARAEQWRDMEMAARRAQLDPINTVAADDAVVAEIARLEREHPEAFGRPASAPRPASEPPKAQENQRVRIASPSVAIGWRAPAEK